MRVALGCLFWLHLITIVNVHMNNTPIIGSKLLEQQFVITVCLSWALTNHKHDRKCNQVIEVAIQNPASIDHECFTLLTRPDTTSWQVSECHSHPLSSEHPSLKAAVHWPLSSEYATGLLSSGKKLTILKMRVGQHQQTGKCCFLSQSLTSNCFSAMRHARTKSINKVMVHHQRCYHKQSAAKSISESPLRHPETSLGISQTLTHTKQVLLVIAIMVHLCFVMNNYELC